MCRTTDERKYIYAIKKAGVGLLVAPAHTPRIYIYISVYWYSVKEEIATTSNDKHLFILYSRGEKIQKKL